MPKCPDRLGRFFPHQLFTPFNPNVSAEQNAGTPDFHYCEPGENETYLQAEICPGEFIAFIHKACSTLLLFASLLFSFVLLTSEKGDMVRR